MNIYQHILKAKQQSQKLLAVLIDPEKFKIENTDVFFNKVHQSIITHVFVGGSTDKNNQTENVTSAIKKVTQLHLAKIGVELTELREDQAEYIGVTVKGPFKPEHYRY